MKIFKSRKAVSPIISSVLIILISITAITLTLTVINPTINRIKDSNIINEALNNLKVLDSAIREVASESIGAKRLITLQISDGSYKIDKEKDQLYFDYDLKSDLKLDGKIQGIEVDSSPVYLEFFNQYKNEEIPAEWVCSGTCKIQSNKFLVSGLAYYNLNQKLKNFFFQLKIENQSGLPEAWISPVNPQNLTLFLTFDEGSGTIAYDFSGNKNNGTLYNGTISCANPPTVGAGCPAWVDGKYGKALSFDGVDDYVNVGNASSLTPTNAITISAWIYPINTTVVVGRIVDKWYSAEAKSSYTLYLENQKVKMAIHTGTSDKYIAGTTTIQKDIWYHVVGTYNGSYVNLYVNGALDATPVSASGSIQTNTGDLNIGRYAYVGTDYFNGTIDEVRIYNKALSEEEIKAEYEAGLKKLSSSGATDFISQPTNVSIVLSNPTGSTLFDDIKIKNQQKKIRLTLFYEKIDLNSTLSISKGIFNLFVEYKGFNETSGRPIIEIRRAE